MELRINLADPVEIMLAVKFMGEIAVHRDSEGCFHASMARSMGEKAAEGCAEQVIAKAKEESKDEAATVEAPAPVAVNVDPQVIIDLARDKGVKVGNPKVKEVIASFGKKTIKEIDPAVLPQLQAALEAL